MHIYTNNRNNIPQHTRTTKLRVSHRCTTTWQKINRDEISAFSYFRGSRAILAETKDYISNKSLLHHYKHHNGDYVFCRLRVVPHFSSGKVEQAKRERAWKSPHARKDDTRRGERRIIFLACRLFSRGVIFTHTRVSLALLSLRKNGGLLVV